MKYMSSIRLVHGVYMPQTDGVASTLLAAAKEAKTAYLANPPKFGGKPETIFVSGMDDKSMVIAIFDFITLKKTAENVMPF